MSILIEVLEKSDFAKSIVQTTQAWVDAPTDLDKAAVAAKFSAELASGFVIGGTVLTAGAARTAMQSLRLGLAVSGRIDQMDKIAAFLGVVEGFGVGSFIDAVNEWNPGSHIYDWLHPASATAAAFTAAQTYVAPPPPRRRDPLVLDLNGNGIETVGINTAAPILFDGNGDGVKTATGWVSANDGMLVWDRNGNGAIDSGRELFSDATVKSDGTVATDGFNALADLDANHDGVVNAQDADFANLRVWRDLNQNGVSDAGEIFTLDTYQIAGINVGNTTVNTALGNGNVLNETGSFVRSDGTTGLAANVNFASNPFYSQFTDALPLSAAIHALPEMQERRV